MSISLIIPIHNAQDDIVTTLRSVSQSLCKKDELILVFDNCSDNSLEACIKWQRDLDENSFHVVKKSVSLGSVSLSRNYGLDLAQKKWIAFSDHDDLVSPSIYKDLLSTAENANVDVVRAGFIEKHSHKENAVYPDFPLDMYAFNGIFVWNSLFRRELLVKNKIRFIPGYGEDYEFNLHVARYAESQEFLRKCVYYWRLHDHNQHKKRKPEDFFLRINSILDNHYDYISSVPNATYSFLKWFFSYTNHLVNLFGHKEVEMAAGTHKAILLYMQDLEGIVDAEYRQALSFWIKKLW